LRRFRTNTSSFRCRNRLSPQPFRRRAFARRPRCQPADHRAAELVGDFDRVFRAFDVKTGKTLWDTRLGTGVRVVAGEPRVRYLHTERGATADVLAAWGELLDGQAQVLTREHAVATGMFGPVDPRHLARIGDVVVISTGDAAVLATGHEPPEAARLIGFHGAATPAEIAIPLIALKPFAV